MLFAGRGLKMEVDLLLLAYRLRCKIERANINRSQIASVDPKSSNADYWQGMADAYADILKVLEKEPTHA